MIERDKRYAILIAILDELLSHGSWCGETHVQKSVYVVNSLLNRELGYEFIMYKHGPFSFDLRSDLGEMRVAHLIGLVTPQFGYGPSIVKTDFGIRLLNRYNEGISKSRRAVTFVAGWFGPKDVKELERVSTAFFHY